MQPENNHKGDKIFSLEELLQDDSFILSMSEPTKESREFWTKQVARGKVKESDYNEARSIVQSLKAKPETISRKEIYDLWENIEIANKRYLRKGRRRAMYLAAAAAVAIGFIITMNIMRHTNNIPEEISAFNIENVKAPETITKNIQLILADKDTLALDGQNAEITHDSLGLRVTGHGNEFQSSKSLPVGRNALPAARDSLLATAGQPVFNQLVVPAGKRSMLVLEDGSKIWVNANTRVVYPETFTPDSREIFVDGEIFLEVAEDMNRPFTVKTRELKMEALGTSFNVMAYEKDSVKSIVLVSGIVKINSPENPGTILTPDQMYSYAGGRYEVRTVNVNDHVSWRSGIYQYRSEPLGKILKRLSLYYEYDINCDARAASLLCSGKLDMKDSLEQVLKGITLTVPVFCNFDNKKNRYVITHN